MPKRKSTGPTNRDLGFGINHGANGKGSKSRVTNPKAYADNFSEINWGVKVVKGEFVKSSDPSRPVLPSFAMIPRDPNKPGFMPILYKRKAKPLVHKDVLNNLVHEDVDTIAKQINSGEFDWDQGERV